MKRLVMLCVAIAACGDDGATPVDAKMIDSTPATVMAVTCPATPDATVTTNAGGTAYDPPATTIVQNGVVKFIMNTSHDVAPNPLGNTDPGLVVDFGQTKCLKFTAKGTFGFYCTVHSFAGTITVN